MSFLTRLVRYGTMSTDPRRQLICREIRREILVELGTLVDHIANIVVTIWIIKWLSQF